MEYMLNGSLKDDLHRHTNEITIAQRIRCAREAAEAVQLLPSADVAHCDVGPSNFLFDAGLGLKIADFAGFSLEGSRATVRAGTRFTPPALDGWARGTVQDDLFGLGSTIYTIMTGHYLFEELPSDEAEKRNKTHEFADVTGIYCGEIIERCWHSEVISAQEIYSFIQDTEMKLACED